MQDLLEEAFAAYVGIAGCDHGNVARQSPSWEAPTTAYDYAALMVKALIRAMYPSHDTELIWEIFVDSLEPLPQDRLMEALTNHYSR